MNMTSHEIWALVHGILLGGGFLVLFAGGLAGLYSLRPELATAAGIEDRVRRLRIGTSLLAVISWLTVITGTFIVYPWYRDPAPDSPKSQLLADPSLAQWHEFAMEWKEHIAWIAPMLVTVTAVIVLHRGAVLAGHAALRRLAIFTLVMSFLVSAIPGLLGALITKAAPVM